MSGWDDESCDIMRHHVTSCDRERKRVGSGWRKTTFLQRRCGRETRWWERKRKAGGSRKRKRKTGGRRKRKGFPLQTVDDYLDQFCDLIYDSGYTDPKTVVVKFRRGLDGRISTALGGMTYGRPSDTDPEAWFRLAVRMDQDRLLSR